MASPYGRYWIDRKAHRAVEDGGCEFWNEPREFSRWEAWQDLIQMAAYREHTRMVDGDLLHIERGEVVGSHRFLGVRWGWSTSKVRRFLKMLQEMERVTVKQRVNRHSYLLDNYGDYQDGRPAYDPETTRSQPIDDPETTQIEGKISKGEGREKEREQQRALELEGDTEGDPAKDPADDLPTLPANLDTEPVRSALVAYDRHRRQKRQKMTDEAWKRLLPKLEAWGPDRTVEALDHSIANGWTGVFEPGNGNGGPPAAGRAKGSTHHLGGAEWLDKRIAEIESEELDQ